MNTLTPETVEEIKAKIESILVTHTAIAPSTVKNLLDISQNSLQGKLYEAYVISYVCEQLTLQEGMHIKLVGGTGLRFRQKGGPINRSFPYFEVYRGARHIGDLFTDTYFHTLSYHIRGSTYPSVADYHELDIGLFKPGASGMPDISEVLLAIECKNTSIKKSIVREMLGFRRELALYPGRLNKSIFEKWPASEVFAEPASVHMIFSTDSHVLRFKENLEIFGILAVHLDLP